MSSPSGAGKSTLSKLLIDKYKNMSMSISTTTRKPRPGEIDGKDYNFVSIDEFEKMVSEDAFLEYARVFDNYYGTPAEPVEAALIEGHDVLFDIDWQGTQQLNEKASPDLVRIFILPPTKGELERRLKMRAQDSDEVVAKRMAQANNEISHWPEYDYVIINDDLEKAEQQISLILRAERLKPRRNVELVPFIKSLTSD